MRKIEKDDLPALANFFINNKENVYFDPFPLTEQSAANIINSDNGDLFYGIFKDGIMIGFGMLRWYLHYKCPTLGLLVDKDHQGQGYGKQIYLYLLDRAKEAGSEEAVAIVRKDNAASLHIARKFGMEALGPGTLSLDGKYDFEEYAKKYQDKIILLKKL